MTRISCRGPGLVPVMALAQRAGLAALVAEHVRPGGDCGVNAYLKVPCLVAGMMAGTDSIDDMTPAAARCAAGAVRRDPGAVHARVAPAVLYLGKCAPAGDGEPAAAGRAGPPGAAAARQGDAGVHRHSILPRRCPSYQAVHSSSCQ